MEIQYKKRARGGYYAFAESEKLGRSVCITVINHPYATGKIGNAGYWVASYGAKTKITMDTRKDAVTALMNELEGKL